MIDMQKYGYEGPCEETAEGLLPARITEVHRELYRAVCARGEVWAALTGSFFHRAEERSDYPAVGDYALLKYNECGNSGITAIFPRKSKFSRTDFSGHAAGYVKTVLEQVVAANFDYVFIMSSLNQDFNVSRIARYLSGAWQSGGVPVVILTKADLCEDPAAQVNAVREMAGGAEVIALSSRSGAGLERLQKYLAPGKTIVFLGMSGVGKSSLVNALAGEELMSVRDIREDDARGRHTTTHRQLIKLPTGAMIIDTPGMRELGRWQGRTHSEPELIKNAPCLSDAGAMRREFAQWSPDTLEYRYLRSAECGMPGHVKEMLISAQSREEELFASFEKLPKVLCHRDFWLENIFIRSEASPLSIGTAPAGATWGRT